jgi:hypothetical protein
LFPEIVPGDDSGLRPVGQTLQVPPYPMVTLAPSTTTGTDRSPFENFSISPSRSLSALTLWYWTVYPSFA